jgi:hypothetical protein
VTATGGHNLFGMVIASACEPPLPLESSALTFTSKSVGELIVTTLPYRANADAKRVWLDRGQSIRKSRGWHWLVLHHEPPALIEPAEAGEFEAGLLLDEYRRTSGSADTCMICRANSEASGAKGSERRLSLRLVKSSKRCGRTISSLIPKSEKSNGEAFEKWAIGYPRQLYESPKSGGHIRHRRGPQDAPGVSRHGIPYGRVGGWPEGLRRGLENRRETSTDGLSPRSPSSLGSVPTTVPERRLGRSRAAVTRCGRRPRQRTWSRTCMPC